MSGDVFAPVAGGDDVTEPAITAMHAAMWQVTFQYFFDSMQATTPDAQLVARARALYAASVRPDGPWRTIVAGNQPYGVLAVSPLSKWVPDGGAPRSAGRLVAGDAAHVAHRSSVRASVGGAGEIGAQLNAVLAQSPRSVRRLTRHARSILIAPR